MSCPPCLVLAPAGVSPSVMSLLKSTGRPQERNSSRSSNVYLPADVPDEAVGNIVRYQLRSFAALGLDNRCACQSRHQNRQCPLISTCPLISIALSPALLSHQHCPPSSTRHKHCPHTLFLVPQYFLMASYFSRSLSLRSS